MLTYRIYPLSCIKMKCLRVFVIAFAFFSYGTLSGQHSLTVEGRIKTANGQHLEGAILYLLQGEEEKMVAYTISRSDGSFSLRFSGRQDSLQVTVRHMGYKTVLLDLPDDHPSFLEIVMEEDIIQLKTIHIKPVAVEQRGDTIRYDLTTLATIDNKTIGDLLKKLPGIEVHETGAIRYRGLPINRFYIENMDLMGGRYGLITKNMAAEYFSTAEIMERHQPVKVLREDVRPANAAINLKLKQKYKSRWMASLDLSLGAAPFLWSESALLMRFAVNSQSLFLVKADNTGKNLFEELQLFNLQRMQSGFYRYAAMDTQDPTERMYFSVGRPQIPPSIDHSVSLLNTSYLGAVNHLSKWSDNLESRLNISYIHSRDTSRSVQHTRYFIPGQDTITVLENNYHLNKKQVYQLEHLLTANTEKFFLENKLYGKLNFSEVNSFLFKGTNTQQQFHLPYSIAGNNFQLIKKIAKTTFTVTSETFYSSSNQSLEVEKDQEITRQEVDYRIMETSNRVSLSKQIKQFKLISEAGIDYSFQTSHTAWENPVLETDSTNSLTRFSNIKCFLGINLNYKANRLSLAIHLPAGWSYENLWGTARWYLRPLVLCIWEPSSDWRIHASGHMNTTPEYPVEEMGTGYLMRNYRTFYLADGDLRRRISSMGSAGISYRNVASLFFANISTQYSYNGSNLYSGQNVFPEYTIHYRLPGNHALHLFLHTISFDKSFLTLPLKIKLNATATEIKGDIIQFGQVTSYDNWSFNGTFGVVCSPGNKAVFGLSYDIRVSGPYVNHANTLDVAIQLSPKLKFKTDVKWLNNQISSSERRNLFFADLNLSCDFNKFHAYISWNNIFNKSTYDISYHSQLSDISLSYTIRPAHILFGVSFNF